ncbi:hypothetical protein SD81_016365 [Tolypothrix campylonemoides VB511288]|nr:hypothetical protein SD81_016365 [Tolypothrix campylonemoides VB511288]
MYNSDFFRLYVLTENSFHQTHLMSATVGGATDNTTTKPPIEFMPDPEHLVAPICLIILWAFAVFLFLSNSWKYLQNRKATINRFQQFRCWNCGYFQDNHYLNCAVHPSIVLTKHALNCPDFWSNTNTTEPESTDDHLC